MCRPDGRHVLNNQGTDDYVLTLFRWDITDKWRVLHAKECFIHQSSASFRYAAKEMASAICRRFCS